MNFICFSITLMMQFNRNKSNLEITHQPSLKVGVKCPQTLSTVQWCNSSEIELIVSRSKLKSTIHLKGATILALHTLSRPMWYACALTLSLEAAMNEAWKLANCDTNFSINDYISSPATNNNNPKEPWVRFVEFVAALAVAGVWDEVVPIV